MMITVGLIHRDNKAIYSCYTTLSSTMIPEYMSDYLAASIYGDRWGWIELIIIDGRKADYESA